MGSDVAAIYNTTNYEQGNLAHYIEEHEEFWASISEKSLPKEPPETMQPYNKLGTFLSTLQDSVGLHIICTGEVLRS